MDNNHNQSKEVDNRPTIVSWNVQGLKTSRAELDLIKFNHKPIAMCLQETMCSKKENISISGYTTYHLPRQDGRRAAGGVITAVRIGIDSEEILINTALEAVVIKVGPPLNICLLNIYLPPNEVIRASELIDLIGQIPKPFIFVGDLNAHHPQWGSDRISPRGHIIEETIDSCQLVVLNSGDPTRLNTATGTLTCIDVACCTTDLAGQLDWTMMQDTHGSDHMPMLITFPGLMSNHQNCARVRWKVEEANWQLYQSSVSFIQLDDAEEQIRNITRAMLEAAEMAIPKTSGRVGNKSVPWWNEEVARVTKVRRKALRKLKNSKGSLEQKAQLANLFRKARDEARKTIRHAKMEGWKKVAESFNVQTPTKEMWGKYSQIQGKKRNTRINAITVNRITQTDDEAIANALGDAFQAVSSNNAYHAEFQQHKARIEAVPLRISNTSGAEYNCGFQINELEEALYGLKGSSPGPDNIHYQMITNLPRDCKIILLDSYNRLWQQAVYPREWCESIVVPIFKNKGERSCPGNYRPIFLNSCVGKVFERMINNRLTHLLETKKLLYKHQYAFRRGKTTTDHLTNLESFIRDSFSKKQYTQAVFLDIKKAYDTTWRRLTLDKLSEWGIGGQMMRFLEQMLEKRTFRVQANGKQSSVKEMQTGLCQGSVLSVTLFLIAIDSITKYIPPNVHCLLYADDVALLACGNDLNELESRLQTAMVNIEQWQKNTGFTISAEKSATIVFRSARTRKPTNPNKLKLNGITIPRTSNHKCIGVTWDQCLKFDKHVEEIRATCQQRVNFIRSIAARDWGGDRKTLMKLYQATVLEKMLYAAPVLSSISDITMKRLETVHNSGIRAITGAFHTSPIASIQAESGIPSVRALFEQRNAIFATRRVALESGERNEEENEPQIHQSDDSSSYEDNTSSDDVWGEEVLEEPNTAYNRGSLVLADLEIELPEIEIFTQPTGAPWERTTILIDKTLLANVQQKASAIELRRTFISRINTKYRVHTQLYTDGSKTDSRTGYSVVGNNLVIHKRLNDMSSIYTAECYALKDALSWVVSQTDVGAYLICTDSLSAITALSTAKTKCNWKDKVQQLYNQARSNGTEVVFMWVPSHVGIPGNEKADEEAKRALERDEPDCGVVNINEIKTTIKRRIIWRWQAEWENMRNNTLREVKNTVLPYKTSGGQTRRDSVVLTRLRIGHTILTHAHLLERKDKPNCTFCNEPISIKHIITQCNGLQNERRRLKLPENLREALAEDEDREKQILSFFKSVNLYSKI